MSDYLRERLGDIDGAETAVQLLQSGVGDTTRASYDRLFGHFAAYCDRVGVSALPASTATVICYVGHLGELGTWAAGSMQPIFSAINDAHRSFELEPPARDSFFLTRVRQGLGRLQAATTTVDSRTPLPAEAPLAFLDFCESQPMPLATLRGHAALCLTALFAGRQDSCVSLRSSDVSASESELWLRLTEKGKRAQNVRRIVRLPLAQSSVGGTESALPRIAALLRRYFQAREAAGPVPEFAFQLQGEVRPTTRSMESWLASALQCVGISAPAGFAYQGHSIRSLGASAMAAIGVPRHVYIWLGGWKRGSGVVDECYVDPTFQPSPAAYALYGWALSHQYSAGAGTAERAIPLPDPRLMMPAPTARE